MAHPPRQRFASEKELLEAFLRVFLQVRAACACGWRAAAHCAAAGQFDPDVLVGYDTVAETLPLVLDRAVALGVPGYDFLVSGGTALYLSPAVACRGATRPYPPS